jgi:hypothetical protein
MHVYALFCSIHYYYGNVIMVIRTVTRDTINILNTNRVASFSREPRVAKHKINTRYQYNHYKLKLCNINSGTNRIFS